MLAESAQQTDIEHAVTIPAAVPGQKRMRRDMPGATVVHTSGGLTMQENEAVPDARTTSPLRLLPATLGPWKGKGSSRDIAVMMSGGVDSSVVALLLKETGWNVLGITMKIPVAERCTPPRPCCGVEAALVCRDLGVPHYFLDVDAAFKELVIEPFRHAYAEGRTPNPCVACNSSLKFDIVWRFIMDTFGIEYLATGHYARVVLEDGHAHLVRGADRSRDQSYFIYGVCRERLPQLKLPLGERTKAETRNLAAQAGLQVAEARDSMEWCFAGEGNYRRALDGVPQHGPGPILDTDGNIIGTHGGIHHYTVGQRRGIGIAAVEPLYVNRIDAATNTIVVGPRRQALRRHVWASNVNVLEARAYRAGMRVYGKTRSVGEPEPCTVTRASERVLAVEFDEPQFAPAPGQHLVLYDGEGRVVAGGVIESHGGSSRLHVTEPMTQVI